MVSTNTNLVINQHHQINNIGIKGTLAVCLRKKSYGKNESKKKQKGLKVQEIS
jgi:hypothetical protein